MGIFILACLVNVCCAACCYLHVKTAATNGADTCFNRCIPIAPVSLISLQSVYQQSAWTRVLSQLTRHLKIPGDIICKQLPIFRDPNPFKCAHDFTYPCAYFFPIALQCALKLVVNRVSPAPIDESRFTRHTKKPVCARQLIVEFFCSDPKQNKQTTL